MSRYTVYLPLLLTLVGCGDPIKRVDLIEEPRVLAARSEVVGAPERSTPNPGETLRVTWLVAAPDGDQPTGFALAACSIPKFTRGVIECSEAPFASDVSDASGENPSFEFSVPADLDSEAQPRLGVLGKLCPNGTGQIDVDRASCDGAELPVSLDMFLAGAETTNLNPGIPSDAIALDGAEWAAASVTNGACSGLGMTEVSLGAGQHQIQIALPESTREALLTHSSADAARESVRISHFVSAGELERPFSEILPSDAAVTTSLSWKPPKTAAPGGQLVRFWFVVRDLRGGADFTERALCLLP
ncbi:MAG: hypothetical protein QM756_37360 [Polyangiaceae bacterium]